MKFSYRKNFLPITYIKKSENINASSNKKALAILMLIGIIFLPINLSKFINIKKHSSHEVQPIVKPKQFIDKKDIILWVELSQKVNGDVRVVNGEGNIIIKSLENIEEIQKFFSVDNIVSSNEGYIIKIKRGNTYEK